MKYKIGIIHYGCGNIFNLIKAFNAIGNVNIALLEEPDDLNHYDLILLPGVGSFYYANSYLEERGFKEAIRTYNQAGGRIIGICLGFQLLLESGCEHGNTQGLSIFLGRVAHLNSLSEQDIVTTPNIGKHSLMINKNKDEPFFDGIGNELFYFDHSYVVDIQEEELSSFATTSYEGITFISYARKDNVIGLQFHPELSGAGGIKLLKNLIMRK